MISKKDGVKEAGKRDQGSAWLRRRHALEYLAARAALAPIRRFPRPALALSRAAASAAFVLCGNRRQLACANIMRTGLAGNHRAARRIALGSFRHMAAVVVESLIVGRRINAANWQEHAELQIDPETDEILRDNGRGLILASGHLGNWEAAGHIVSYITPRLAAVAKPLHNLRVQALLDEHGARSRLHILSKRGANPRQLVRCLQEQGETLAILIDQHSYHPNAPKPLFFGHPAATHPSAAILSRISEVPIAFIVAARLGFLRYRLVIGPPWRPAKTSDRRADEVTIMQSLTDTLEKAVRQYPEQYLWAHHRWKK